MRKYWIEVPCGNCMECRKKRAREWRARLLEEFYDDSSCSFVTLTFSNEAFVKLTKDTGIEVSNALATIAVRRWLERIRKRTKKSAKHWLITELGGEFGRLHLHGLLWGDKDEIKAALEDWKYGFVYNGKYVNDKTVNYIIKYIFKWNETNKDFKPQILCSKGIGGNAKLERCGFNDETTKDNYRLKTGKIIALPKYYRAKLYSEEERDKLWTIKLDKGVKYVLGKEIDVKDGLDYYLRVLKEARNQSRTLKLGDGSKNIKKCKENLRKYDIDKENRIKLEQRRRAMLKQC